MAEIPDAVYEAAAEALIATRDVIRAETDWCLECAGEEVAALRAAKIALDAVAPLLIAEGRRQAAEALRTKGATYVIDVDREGLSGAESAYAGVTDMEHLGYKAVWLMAEREGEGSPVRWAWRYVEAALKAAREAAARTAEGTDGG